MIKIGKSKFWFGGHDFNFISYWGALPPQAPLSYGPVVKQHENNVNITLSTYQPIFKQILMSFASWNSLKHQ